MAQEVRTVVFPVAGRGTRFLPVTKSVPKELLPIVDKPLIQYAVEEAVAAGATRLVFVTHSSKAAIERHFESDKDLERALERSGRQDLLQVVRDTVEESFQVEPAVPGTFEWENDTVMTWRPAELANSAVYAVSVSGMSSDAIESSATHITPMVVTMTNNNSCCINVWFIFYCLFVSH